MADTGSRVTGRLVFGLVVVALGVLFLLDNLDLAESGDVLRWWPLALVGVGLYHAFGPRRRLVTGAIFTGVGAWMLLHEFGYVREGPWDLWPALLILVGVMLVTKAMRGTPPPGPDSSSDAQISAFALWSGTTRRIASTEFRGGDITAIMGGHDIDLRSAQLAGGTAVLDLFVWWGGVDIFVPKDWKVTQEGLAIMGAFEDNTKPEGEPRANLILKGLVVMGGVEIKN